MSDPLLIGTQVNAGHALMQLELPDLCFHLEQTQACERLLQWDAESSGRLTTICRKKVWRCVKSGWSLLRLQEQTDRLFVRVPFAGLMFEPLYLASTFGGGIPVQ